MSVNVAIKRKKEISVEEIADLKNLNYGILDENYILEWDKVGKYTILYYRPYIGRGFDVSMEEENIVLNLPLPSTPHDIEIFYDLIEKLAKKMNVKEFVREEEIVPITEATQFIDIDKNSSINFIKAVASEIKAKKKNNFIIFGALNPIVIGEKEIDYIGDSLDNFEKLLNSRQEMDVFYAGPKIYQRKDGTIFGLYFIGEEIVSVVPKKPSIPNNKITISDYYCLIPAHNAIPYSDFISNVSKIDDYDSEHIVISLDEKKINDIAEKYAVNYTTNEKEYHKYYSLRIIDNGKNHNGKISRLKLDCDKLSGYNHLSVFLKWAYSEELLNDDLLIKVPELKEALCNSLKNVRKVLNDSIYLNGEIRLGYFKEYAQPFVKDVYKFSGDGYPKWVDKYAEKILGTKEYNNKKYKNEAYLFVPFDEEYYIGLSKYIDDAWNKYNESYITSSNFVYDEKNHCFKATINSIYFECEKVLNGYEEKAILLSKKYKEKLPNIIEKMKEEIIDFYGEISNQELIDSLGIPTINLDNDLMTYTEHTLDNTHIIDVEFNGMFDEIFEVRIDG